MARGKKKETLTPEERLQAALVPESEQPYKVPGNWRWTFLKPISKIRTGKKDANYGSVDGEYPFFTCAAEPIRCHGYSFDCNAILLAGNGDINNISRYSGKFEAYQRTYVVEIIEPINIDYVFYWFKYRWFDFNKDKMFGTAIPYIRLGNLQEFPIPVPPLAQQQRIIDHIESLFAKLDEAKQKAQDALDSFETRKAAILHKAFTGELTAQWRKEHGVGMESWENLRLENLIEGGPQNGLYKPQTAYGTGTKILRIDCFYKGAVLPWENLKRLALSKNEIEQYHLNINDIVINRVNSMAYLGKSALIRELPEECVFESNMMRIALNTRMVIPEYAIKYLNSVIGVQELRKNAKQAVNQASINQQDVKNVAIKLPKLDEQAEIVRLLDDLLAKEQQTKEAAEGVLGQIDLIKKAILALAFRGELGTNDPSEESAVELLKQISSC